MVAIATDIFVVGMLLIPANFTSQKGRNIW